MSRRCRCQPTFQMTKLFQANAIIMKIHCKKKKKKKKKKLNEWLTKRTSVSASGLGANNTNNKARKFCCVNSNSSSGLSPGAGLLALPPFASFFFCFSSDTTSGCRSKNGSTAANAAASFSSFNAGDKRHYNKDDDNNG